MTVKRLLKAGALVVLASLMLGALQLVAPGALPRAMTAIASAVWGS